MQNFTDHPFYASMNNVRSDSPASSARVEQQITELINGMLKTYPSGRVSRADLWVSRLVEMKYNAKEIKKAVDYVINNCERCPSFAEFRVIVSSSNRRHDEGVEDAIEEQKKYDKEIDAYKKMRAEVVSIIGEDGLQMFFLKAYLPQIYPGLSMHHKSLGIPLNTFERLAVVDLYRAKLKLDDAIKLASVKNQIINKYKKTHNKLPESQYVASEAKKVFTDNI